MGNEAEIRQRRVAAAEMLEVKVAELRQVCVSELGQSRFQAVYEFLSAGDDEDGGIRDMEDADAESELSQLLGVNVGASRLRDAVRKVGQLLCLADRLSVSNELL